jgi:glycosyltransferase involved in cell wall biosynthesis
MNVVLLSDMDNANLSYILTQSLRSAGVEASSYKKALHNYKYPEQSSLFKDCNMIKIIADADIIQYMHSKFIDVGGDHSSKKRVVFHGGSAYRKKSNFRNKIFNNIVDISIIQTGDMLGLGSKNEKWLLPPINTEVLKPNYTFQGINVPIFAHYPSNPKKKGTSIIKSIINKLNLNTIFNCEIVGVEWQKQIQRMSECDIYIELFLPILGNRKYGEWGMTALEAASLGKIVVTNFLSLDRYKIEYGNCPFVVCNTIDQLEKNIFELSKMSKDEILEKKRLTRKWVEKYHSYQAVGKKLKSFYDELF